MAAVPPAEQAHSDFYMAAHNIQVALKRERVRNGRISWTVEFDIQCLVSEAPKVCCDILDMGGVTIE